MLFSTICLRRKNISSCEISHFPVSKQTVKVQFLLDGLGKVFIILVLYLPLQFITKKFLSPIMKLENEKKPKREHYIVIKRSKKRF